MGSRVAGKLWEDTYTQAMEHAECVTGTTNPGAFYHKMKDSTVVVRGDDFTALGTDNDLDWYENHLKDNFEIQVRGRLGNHTDLRMSSLNLTTTIYSSTPGVQPHDKDDLAVKVNEPDSTALDDYSNPDAAIAAICPAGPVGCEKAFGKL